MMEKINKSNIYKIELEKLNLLSNNQGVGAIGMMAGYLAAVTAWGLLKSMGYVLVPWLLIVGIDYLVNALSNENSSDETAEDRKNKSYEAIRLNHSARQCPKTWELFVTTNSRGQINGEYCRKTDYYNKDKYRPSKYNNYKYRCYLRPIKGKDHGDSVGKYATNVNYYNPWYNGWQIYDDCRHVCPPGWTKFHPLYCKKDGFFSREHENATYRCKIRQYSVATGSKRGVEKPRPYYHGLVHKGVTYSRCDDHYT